MNETGQQLRNFAARYDLPRETLIEVFSVQTELDALEKSHRPSRYRGPNGPPPAEIQERVTELQQQIESILGPDRSKSWNDGRKRQYDLQP